MIGYLTYLIKHPDFQYNQKYEPSHIYNRNEQQVFNEIHTGE